ncbi:MAG: Bax inhibitor-1/YccA family protein [Flavobacteriia bacterium]|nr:Bax inhibitor-1/YccA family protein [Flavobacteriia bacterium]
MNNIFGQQHEGYSKEITREFFKNVYSYMFAALAISGAIAYYVGTSNMVDVGNGQKIPEFFLKYFISASGGLSTLFYIVMFAPLGLGLLIQMAYRSLSLGLLIVLFIAYSALMGLSLSSIFLVYSGAAIYSTFFITAGAFGAMAILGYTTKTDLTKFGSLLYMVFIGMMLALLVNMFMHSQMMDYVISIIGVFVFTGLTAYYMQQLKSVSKDTTLSEVDRSKLSLIGGLQLYILFVNLFLTLLRLLGNRD